jgi:hypothetical protein
VHIPDLSAKTYSTHKDGFEYLSVGWLGDQVTVTGRTEPTIVATLRFLRDINQLPSQWRGQHICAICWVDRAAGEFFVEGRTVRYVLPNMVIHYMTEHEYKLPDVVESAVRRSAAFTQEDWEMYERSREADESHDAVAVARQVGKSEGLREGLRAGIAAGHKSGFAAGELEGKRDAVLRLVTRAGIALTKDERGRIHACTDTATLDLWIEHVLGAKTAADVFV